MPAARQLRQSQPSQRLVVDVHTPYDRLEPAARIGSATNHVERAWECTDSDGDCC